MSLFRSALCAVVLCAAGAHQGWAFDDAPSGALEKACDLACQMQAYFNRDHMVRLVPISQEQANRDAGAPTRKARAAARRGTPSTVGARRVPSVAPGSPSGTPTETASARPARTAETAPAAAVERFRLNPVRAVNHKPKDRLASSKGSRSATPDPAVLVQKPDVEAPLPPSPIPGSAPRVTTTQFVDPLARASAY